MSVGVAGPSVGMSSGVPPDNARIATGTYTGDGTVSQTITGVGFRPKFVKIWVHATSGISRNIFEKSDTMDATRSARHLSSGGHFAGIVDALIALGADGFTVDDNGSDIDPNKDTEVYDYIAWG